MLARNSDAIKLIIVQKILKQVAERELLQTAPHSGGSPSPKRTNPLGALGKSVLDKARMMEARIKFLEGRVDLDDARARGVKPPSRGGGRVNLGGERVGGVKCPLDVRIRSSVKKL